jgi:GT2 family glycosyltransferase
VVDISICIVTLKARDFLRECLNSLEADPPGGSLEIIVVENHSSDGTVEMLRQDYPTVQLIENETNAGFVRPMNQAMHAASGRFVLLLNPDTVVLPGAADSLIDFFAKTPQAGICGPKVLNRDRSLQKSCRRGEPRPVAVLSYFLGLSKLFPRSKFFGGYLMNYMDEDALHEVAGVAGSCMLIRREVIEQIGYLDERFFAYQEDADYCFQARKAGWKIYYVPQAQIIHYGGQGGSRVQPYRSIYEWHRSYFLYYRKNLASDYFFLFNWFYYLAMGIKFSVSLTANALRREKYAGPRRG